MNARGNNGRARGRVAAACVSALLACAAPARAEPWDAGQAAYDDLLYRATCYGDTQEKRTDKDAARAEVFRRGDAALREIMARVHLENLMLQVLADEVTRYHVAPEKALPVLADFLSSEDAATRRTAAYLMGFLPGPEYADRVLPLLDDASCRRSAIRTLGKWKVAKARPALRALLRSEQERTRIAACNALRDIGDEDDLPHLVRALADPAFLVRNTASRAIVAYGWSAQRPLMDRLASSRGAQQRQIVRLLGELRARAAIRPLRRLLDTDDPGLAADVAVALRQIDPGGAARWLRDRAIPPVQVDATVLR